MQLVATRTDVVDYYQNHRKVAREAKLKYVHDSIKGITRKRKGRGLFYYFDDLQIKDQATLGRIKKLAIPPAWEKVWICPHANGHIQATGFDVKGRKQYRYHNTWSARRNQTKYHRLFEFGKALPSLRKRIEDDIRKPVLSKQKVLATVLSLMERTCIRIGNNEYEKLYGSYGLTTLKDGHVNINGSQLKFSFKGKKGIFHTVTLKSKRLAKIVKACRDIPGKELFQYIDDQGDHVPVDSGMVNDYIKEATEQDFSAKDLRTWEGSVLLLAALHTMGKPETESDLKKNIQAAIGQVCEKLGNTRTVCRKYYIHPVLIKLYEEAGLQSYFKQLDASGKCDDPTGLAPEEQVLMKILK